MTLGRTCCVSGLLAPKSDSNLRVVLACEVVVVERFASVQEGHILALALHDGGLKAEKRSTIYQRKCQLVNSKLIH